MLNNNKISQKSIYILVLTLMLFVLFTTDLLIGSEIFSLKEIISALNDKTSAIYTILTEFRLPRAITAVLAGSALSLSGLLMQTIFRNPLSGPYILGISSGAGLGVALLVMSGSVFGISVMNSNMSIVIAAWLGALMVLLLTLAVSVRVKDIMTLLVLGILFGSGISALVNILQFFSNNSELKSFVLWTMGSLDNVANDKILIFVIAVIAGIFTGLLSVKPLNALILGEIYAKSMGVNIVKSRLLIFVVTGILTGTVTAFCGPIGFIGIVIPHLSRLLFSTANHIWLIPGSIILGADIMLISDIISQMPGSQLKLPINTVTALFGIPVIIWLIVKNKRINL